MLNKLFTDHPASVGESYLEHQRVAASFAGPLLMAGMACLVHAVVPCLFETTASRTVKILHHRLVVNRQGDHAGNNSQSGALNA